MCCIFQVYVRVIFSPYVRYIYLRIIIELYAATKGVLDYYTEQYIMIFKVRTPYARCFFFSVRRNIVLRKISRVYWSFECGRTIQFFRTIIFNGNIIKKKRRKKNEKNISAERRRRRRNFAHSLKSKNVLLSNRRRTRLRREKNPVRVPHKWCAQLGILPSTSQTGPV